MKGRSAALRKIADQILSLRGVKHGKFVVTTTGKDLK
jgi:CopG family nickel-responsive transcriptional regulator